MPVSEEHMKLLEKQNALVNRLKEVLAIQQRAIEALGTDDEDYEQEPDSLDACDSDNEGELTKLLEETEKAKRRTRSRPADDSDAPNQDWEATEEEERGFMSVKPWLGAMKKPTNWSWEESKDRDAAPPAQLVLDHVHGYRARACRNNVALIDGDTIAYPAAGVCVVHSISNKSQRFFRGHDDDVLCLDYNRDRRLIASGQQGKNPALCIWSVDDCKEVAVFHTHQRAVVSCSISPDGTRVASVGLDNDHSIAVHDIDTKECLVHTKGDTNRILAVYWNLTGAADSSREFVSLGSKHIRFWQMNGGSCSSKKGLLGRNGRYQTFLDCAFTPDHTLIACESGEVYAFSDNKLKTVVPCHNGACFAIICDPKTDRIFTGGRDGTVKVYDRSTFKSVASYNLTKADQCLGLNSVKALYLHGSSLVVGTITSSLFCIDLNTDTVSSIHSNHAGDLKRKDSYGELWGLAVHPLANKYATVGEDRSLRIWDVQNKTIEQRATTSQKGLCCAYSPDGKLLAVGFHQGSIAVYQTHDLIEVYRSRRTRERILAVRFSPNGKWLATAGADGIARLYSVDDDDFTYSCKLEGCSSNILSIDFTADSEHIQVCSQAYELLCYKAESGARASDRSLRDAVWDTQSSKLGWNVQGIWQKEADGSDVNMVNVSRDKRFLISSEDSGNIRLFNFPCVGSGLDRKGSLGRRPESVTGLAHSEHVTNAQFTADGLTVVSIGGADNCVMHWRLVQ